MDRSHSLKRECFIKPCCSTLTLSHQHFCSNVLCTFGKFLHVVFRSQHVLLIHQTAASLSDIFYTSHFLTSLNTDWLFYKTFLSFLTFFKSIGTLLKTSDTPKICILHHESLLLTYACSLILHSKTFTASILNIETLSKNYFFLRL